VGDASLVFGRIDRDGDHGGDAFHIGRVAVADEHQDPVVVDWRAPVAEPFYRATGRNTMGLSRRRHFAIRGRTLLGIEDEVFGDAEAFAGAGPELSGRGAVVASLESARTGRLGDIVATIQAEQDEIIRSELPGILIVQGGPGTGKTVVALHRAAYLLYTHRFPLEGQGVLVVGPNRLFLAYVEQVLPSLGEAGVELAVTADLVDGVTVGDRDHPELGRIKGDVRMAEVLVAAVGDRQRPLRRELAVGYGLTTLRLSVAESGRIVQTARRRFRRHNPARRFVERQVFEALADSSRHQPDPEVVRESTRWNPEVRNALEWMWPRLTPAQLLHDLYGSRALLRSAAQGHVSADTIELLQRPRSSSVDDVIWTTDDVPLLDESNGLLGSPRRGVDVDPRTYGHIVVDEAQDRSPMELRMLTRRSLGGSMTVVGDVAQATGPWGVDDWDDVLAHLPDRRDSRHAELTVGYRIPRSIVEPGNRVLAVAAPQLTPPDAVREGEHPARFVSVDGPDRLADVVVLEAGIEADAVDPGNVAVIVPRDLVDPVVDAFDRAQVEIGRATRSGLEARITLVPVDLVKGLELDAAVVVEPAALAENGPKGLRSLYVALTRATRRLTIVHARALPDALRE
jgi:DNA helicase IV